MKLQNCRVLSIFTWCNLTWGVNQLMHKKASLWKFGLNIGHRICKKIMKKNVSFTHKMCDFSSL